MFWFVSLLGMIAVTSSSEDVIETRYICPKDFYLVGRKCYHFSETLNPWSDSHFYCQIQNGSLAIVESNREQRLLSNFLSQTNRGVTLNEEKWIDGIYDWRQNKWKWGSSGNFMFNSFARNNLGTRFRWNCIAIDAIHNKWMAKKCIEKKQVICETKTNTYIQFKIFNKKGKFKLEKCSSGRNLTGYERRKCMKLLGNVGNNDPAKLAKKSHPTRATRHNRDVWLCPRNMVALGNRCYLFGETEKTWEDAHFECRQNKTKLAVLRNKAQDHNLRRYLNNFVEKYDRWIGGMYDWRSEQWKWAMTGQQLKYKGFASDVMKYKTPKDLYWNTIFMDPKLHNQWNAAPQVTRKRYICQIKAKAVKIMSTIKKNYPQATVTILTEK